MPTQSGNYAEYQWREIPADTPQPILDAMGGREAASKEPAVEPVRVIRAGVEEAWPVRGRLTLEDGGTLAIDGRLPADLPLGYHEFQAEQGDGTTRVIVTPWQCMAPALRRWGWAAQLHSTRSAESWGIGDLADLGRLARWSAELGAGVLLVNPLCAPAPVVPQGASPYYPVSRRFRNPLYLHIEDVPGVERLGTELATLAAEARSLNSLPRLDRDRVFHLKQKALRAIWSGFGNSPAFAEFRRQQGDAITQFATYCALAEQLHEEDYRKWPAEYRRPESAAVGAFAAQHAGDIRYHEWLQWLLEAQLERASRGLAVLQDLPIGMSPGGADAWQWQDLLAADITVGAPPDAFNSDGQDWQLPPFVPWKLRAARYEPFIQTIRATLRHAGGLRIDHVMGLFRLWWIPQGMHPQRGWYVRYPADDLLGIVALESHRARAVVVGEDLGTVEPGVRERLAERRVMSCRLLWFERRPPAEYPQFSMASLTTHDLPTVAGLRSGADHAAQQRIGMPANDETLQLRARLQQMLGVADDAPVAEVIERAYRKLAESPSMICTATLEDAQAVEERPNMPGTIDQWPNWSLALPQNIEAMQSAELPRRIARALAAPHGEMG